MSNFPENLKYTEEHEWVRVEGDIAVAGITAYAAEQLGGVTFVEFPELEDEVGRVDVLGAIESYKGFSDLFSPLSGVVIEVNVSLEEDWEILDKDPYGDGWLLKIRLSIPSVVEQLLDSESYKNLVEAAQ